MKTGRFFVTSVLILAIAMFVACTPKKEKHAAELKEGTQQLHVASTVQEELDSKFQILIMPMIQTTKTGTKVIANLNLAYEYNWRRLTRAERQAAKLKLSEYVTSVARSLEIDARQGVYLLGKETLQYQLAFAQAYQKALEDFESMMGEGYEPKNPKEQPHYIKTSEA